ncbi:MAG: hypothetical protein PHN75_14835, partial [Syntrophales bacterium]|nr:hypothetical protein [Syntrophales bacterium]
MEISAPEGPLKPGKTGTINLSLGTGHTRGKYKKIVEISTNDPQKTDVTLIMQATIVEQLSVTPAFIDFGLVKITPEEPGANSLTRRTKHLGDADKRPEGSRRAGITREFTITNRGTRPIDIAGITANPAEQLTVFPRKRNTLKPGEQQRLQVCLTPA